MEANQYSQTEGHNDEGEDEEARFKIYTKADVTKTHNIYLSEHVENNFVYCDLLNKLRAYTKKEVVELYLANYGGQCSTGFQLFNAIKACQARVNVTVDAPCYSMGAILALSGNSLILQPGSFLMFHNYSSVEMGKGTELHKAVTHYHKHFHKHLGNVCGPFLDKKELDELKRDNDVYVSYYDANLEKRIKRHFG